MKKESAARESMDQAEKIKEIMEALQEAQTILLLPHISLDGDCLGSSVAFCRALRKLGKEALILLEDEIPDYLDFLVNQGEITYDCKVFPKPDLCISIDCGDASRYPERAETFKKGKLKICIDHHVTNESRQDIDLVDGKAAATGELIFYVIQGIEAFFHMEIMDKTIAEALYVAIVQDTGNFSYTNTRKETHLITADLFDWGFDLEKVGVELYQSTRAEKLYLSAEVLGTLEMFCESKANVAYMTQDMLLRTGAVKDESEGFIDMLRELKGVEISAFLKEKSDGNFKVSLRSKTYGDVGGIAVKNGGGGHRKAAGFNIEGPLEHALKVVKEEICARLES